MEEETRGENINLNHHQTRVRKLENSWPELSKRQKIRNFSRVTNSILRDLRTDCAESGESIQCSESSDSDTPSLNSSLSLDEIFQKLDSSSCSSISEDTESNGVQTDHIADGLARWVSEFNIPNNATTKLFHILNNKIPSLPLDARTLLKTTRNVNVEKFCNGSYIYFGIENS